MGYTIVKGRSLPTYSEFYKSTTLEKRKSQGQYMTPDTLADTLAKAIPFKDGDKVLEPALGTGQLVKAVLNNNPTLTLDIDGWEQDEKVLEYVEPSVEASTHITQASSLTHALTVKQGVYDVVLSNPPFYEFKPDAELKAQYSDVISGRANIFSLFFKLSIDMVKPGGYVGFIVPPSMNNGNFFNSLRSYITQHCSVVHLRTYPSDLFEEAQTAVQVIVLRKLKEDEAPSTDHIITHNGINLFVESKKEFESYWDGAVSLSEAGYSVKTGTVVWNKHKDDFEPHRGTESIPLIYAKDLKMVDEDYDTSLYTDRRFLPSTIPPAFIREPFVAVNRVVGGANKKLRAKAYGPNFYAENHVNFIIPTPGATTLVSVEELTELLNNVPSHYLSLLSGNTQISKTELEQLIPLKLG